MGHEQRRNAGAIAETLTGFFGGFLSWLSYVSPLPTPTRIRHHLHWAKQAHEKAVAP